MRGVYTVVFQRVAVTAAQDLFLLVTSSTVPIEILRCEIGQNSDFGDAQDELLAIRHRTGMTTNGSGGSTPTPNPTHGTTAASGVTAHANDTTASSAGTILEAYESDFNVRSGYLWVMTPEERIVVAASSKWALNLPAAPADSLTMSGTVVYRELF